MIDKEGRFTVNLQDEIIKGTAAVHAGQYISQRVKQLLNIK
jgi:hypothetical protein